GKVRDGLAPATSVTCCENDCAKRTSPAWFVISVHTVYLPAGSGAVVPVPDAQSKRSLTASAGGLPSGRLYTTARSAPAGHDAEIGLPPASSQSWSCHTAVIAPMVTVSSSEVSSGEAHPGSAG